MAISGNIIKIYNIDEDIFHTSGSTTPLNLEVVNADDLPISGCVEVNSVLIKTFPENLQLNDCGCPTDECGEASLKITIKNINPPTPKCVFDGFVLDSSGLILFTINGVETYNVPAECCTNLGFTSELDSNNIAVCRWGVSPSICSPYSQIGVNGGYVLFSDTDGPNTYEVPSAECCPVDTIPQQQDNGYYKCIVRVVVDPIDCSLYTYSSYDDGGYAVFVTTSGSTSNVPSAECCSSVPFTTTSVLQPNGGYRCLISCGDYIDYSFDPAGYVLFTGTNGDIYSEVPYAQCCPRLTMPELVLLDPLGDATTIVCKSTRGGGNDVCRYLSVLLAIPNPSGGLTNITVSGLYCDGTEFSYSFVSDTGPISVDACIIPNSLVISPNAPQRVQYTWDDSQSCSTSPTPNFNMLGLRSAGNSITPLSCSNTSNNNFNYGLTEQCFLHTVQSLVLNVGDYVYGAGFTSIPFNGNNKWYKLAFSIVDTDTDYYYAKIATNGVILDITHCS